MLLGPSSVSVDAPLEPEVAARCVELLKELVSGALPTDYDDELDELLTARPAIHWEEVLYHAGCLLSISSGYSHAATRLLRGRRTLYEVLGMLGPEWARVRNALQNAAQQRLFNACSLGIECSCWSTSLENMFRAGAQLLRADGAGSWHGRVATHMAAESGSDVLQPLISAAPISLLVEDDEGSTPLDLLVDSPLLDDAAMLESLGSAALSCLATMPEQTARVLARSHNAARKVWTKIAKATGCNALLVACDRNVDKELESQVEQYQLREGMAAAKVRRSVQTVRLLEALMMDRYQELAKLEPQVLRLRLAQTEEAFQKYRDSTAKQIAEFRQENKQLKCLLANREDDLLRCQEESRHREQVQETQVNAASDLSVGVAKQVVKHKLADVRLTEEHAEEAIVKRIQSSRLFNMETHELPECIRSDIIEMQASLAAAVDRLAHDLYASKAHFLQELIQNADDNKYDAHVNPALHFTFRTRTEADNCNAYFFTVNNELGLTEADVRSICDISRSTKSTASNATTGYKGVGWKSVFGVCERPYVLSRKWKFRFSSNGLGMLTPEWIDDLEYRTLPEEVRAAHAQGGTVFYLPISDASIVRSIEGEMRAIESDAAQFLFFRRLREVHFCHSDGRVTCVSVTDSDAGLATVRTHVIAHGQDIATGADNSEAVGQVEHLDFEMRTLEDVTIAFSLTENPSPQRVFAVLPVQAVGFRFAVHAPFELTASRTDLHRSTQNARRRDVVARAFLSACCENEVIATNALKHLGSEPADPFWHVVWTNILAGLQSVACVPTQNGIIEPHRCVRRGSMPAAKWVPESLLAEACKLQFALDADQEGLACGLGLRIFGFNELATCLCHNNAQWLRSCCQHDSVSTLLSDIYSSLAEALQEDPDRINVIQDIPIFPNMGRQGHADSAAGPVLCTCTNIYARACGDVPLLWQTPLVNCLSNELHLTARAQTLLELLGVHSITESELEHCALRSLTAADQRGANVSAEITWASLAILRRCFLLNRVPPRPWAELRDALALPSDVGDMLPPSRLRMRTFLGIEMKLTRNINKLVFEMAGFDAPHPSKLDCLAAPLASLFPAVCKGQTWYLGWEVFLSALGCQVADPTGSSNELLLEATLGLGSVLSSGAFWQQCIQSESIMSYLLSTIAASSPIRRSWLRRIAVDVDGHIVPLKELFLQSAFQGICGRYVPYIQDIPPHPQILFLLKCLGVAVEVNQENLLRCIRWLRAQEVEDIGIAANIYTRLESLGFTGANDEEFILVPEKGYLRSTHCSWYAFQSNLLQLCCETEAISEHYDRFGSSVTVPLRKWVRERPEDDAHVLCNTLQQLIACVNRWPRWTDAEVDDLLLPKVVEVDPREAVRGLFDAVQTIVRALALLHASGVDIAAVACERFARRRMIVVPCGQDNYTLLRPTEAFWAVAPEIPQNSGCASMALQLHYDGDPATKSFFIDVLQVRPELLLADATRLTASAVWVPAAQDGSEASGIDHRIVSEGWSAQALFPRPEVATHAQSTPENVLTRALRNASRTGLPQEMANPNASGSQTVQAPQVQPPPKTVSRQWRRVGELAGLPVFSADAVNPPYVGCPDLSPLFRLCSALSLQINQIGFGFDSSGRCVCDSHLLLELTRVPRVLHLRSPEAVATFWAAELCHAVAYQAVGSGASHERLFEVELDLLAQTVPMVVQYEMQLQWQRSFAAC